jgi:hypothetical protein
MKDWMEHVDMNKALIKCGFSLLLQEHRTLYGNKLIGNPNCKSGNIFSYFTESIAFATKWNLYRAANRRKRHGTLWTGSKSFATTSTKQLPSNLLLNAILKMGIFQMQCKE